MNNYRIHDEIIKDVLFNDSVFVYITEDYEQKAEYHSSTINPSSSYPVLVVNEHDEAKDNLESKKIKMVIKTNLFLYFYGVHSYDLINLYDFPIINFKTGEIKDKPGVFLNFDNPETLDDQLAEIYGLTKEEQELMATSIKPWKDKLSLTADGLY